MIHKRIPRKLRERVWNKYDRHCAYCGCGLAYEDMQVDHAESVWATSYKNRELTQNDDFDNLMPSCRQCNFYKGSLDIEGFREAIKLTLQRTCVDTPQARLAMKYGIIKVEPWGGKFYFEK